MRNMDNPDKLIPPNDFLTRYRKRWKISRAHHSRNQAHMWIHARESRSIINFTADDINHPNRAREIHDQIIQYEVDPNRFTIEILEGIQDISLAASDNYLIFESTDSVLQ